MNLPQQVRDAGKRADDAMAAHKAKAEAPPPNTEGQALQDTPPASEPKEDWKTKYLVLQGKYNAEVPRLSADLKAANARVEQLTGEVATLKATAPKPAASEPADELTGISQDARDALGDEAVKAILKITRGEIGPMKDQLQTAAKTADELAADRMAEAQQRFFGDLERLVPDYREVDARQDWKDWLAANDPFSRKQRQTLITEAAQAMDVAAVAAFFDAFKASAGLTKPEPGAADPRAHLQVPDTAGRAAAPVVDKKIWTKKEVAQFYADVTKGVYKREKITAIGQEIEAASREGRVR